MSLDKAREYLERADRLGSAQTHAVALLSIAHFLDHFAETLQKAEKGTSTEKSQEMSRNWRETVRANTEAQGPFTAYWISGKLVDRDLFWKTVVIQPQKPTIYIVSDYSKNPKYGFAVWK